MDILIIHKKSTCSPPDRMLQVDFLFLPELEVKKKRRLPASANPYNGNRFIERGEQDAVFQTHSSGGPV